MTNKIDEQGTDAQDESQREVVYSPSTGGFYFAEDQEYFETVVGLWPNDMISLNEYEREHFWKASAPYGKILGVVDGRLAWVDLPPPTEEEVRAQVIAKRDALMAKATVRIAPLQDAVDDDDASPAEVIALKAWKDFRKALNRLEQQPGFPVTIEWPVEPS